MAKESMNQVSISGKIIEITHRSGLNKNNIPYIGGIMTIETGEDVFIPVSFYAQEKTNAGKPNSIYKSLETVIKEFKTVNEHGREAADSVEIVNSAKLSENIFFVAEDRMIRGFQINSSFFNRKANATPGNEFTLTGDILSISENVKDDVPTGTLTVRLLVIGYGSKANVLDLQVKDPAGVKYVKSVFDAGMEVKVKGIIKIEETVEEKKEEAAFGDAIVTTKRHTERELIITSATPPITTTLTEEEKNTLLAVRETEIKTKKEDFLKTNKTAGNSKPSAANFSL